MKRPLEQLGRAVGWLSAPLWAAGSTLRRARVLHPTGQLAYGTIEVGDPPDELEALASALQGPALVRFSNALWRRPGTHRPDVLGCAIRLTDDGGREAQDLLFATIKRPVTLPFAPLTTDVEDFLDNRYFGISPFDLEGSSGRFYLRLRPLRRGGDGATPSERLARALDEGPVGIAIEASRRPRGPWHEIAILRVLELGDDDDPSLRFDPFTDGRGIRPRGMIHALRRGAYRASQAARVRLGGRRTYSKARPF